MLQTNVNIKTLSKAVAFLSRKFSQADPRFQEMEPAEIKTSFKTVVTKICFLN
jgi:hypothetical protein